MVVVLKIFLKWPTTYDLFLTSSQVPTNFHSNIRSTSISKLFLQRFLYLEFWNVLILYLIYRECLIVMNLNFGYSKHVLWLSTNLNKTISSTPTPFVFWMVHIWKVVFLAGLSVSYKNNLIALNVENFLNIEKLMYFFVVVVLLFLHSSILIQCLHSPCRLVTPW